ncbi:MAG: mechanosensitive ion channel family protein [Aestuariibacter sp.]
MLDNISNFLNFILFSLDDKAFTVGDVLLIPAVLIGGYLLLKWFVSAVAARLTSKGVAADVIHLLRRLLFVIGLALLIITTLDMINVPLTAFAFLSGAIAIGFGFGAQNIINNFISGWILMWERPIRIGDFLEVDDARGKVESINTRSTRIRRVDGVHMLIPNSKLLENTVVNWTLVDRLTRSSVRIGVAYGSPVRQVSELIMQATKTQAAVLGEPEPVVIFEDFGDNSLVFEVSFWIHATVERDLRIIRSDIRFELDALFAQHGIVIAFPQRDVHIDGALKLIQENSAR